MRVEGEITDFRIYGGSGHHYFKLKEGNAVLDCKLWGSVADRVLDFEPEDGMQVLAYGRLDVYADMYFYRLRDCLAEDFPKLAELVGEARFHNLVTDYLLRHPSSHPSLRELGRRLPAFLADHAIAAEFPVAADLARLEWARVDVFDERDVADAIPKAEAAKRGAES